jgi:hypothetical protein
MAIFNSYVKLPEGKSQSPAACHDRSARSPGLQAPTIRRLGTTGAFLLRGSTARRGATASASVSEPQGAQEITPRKLEDTMDTIGNIHSL